MQRQLVELIRIYRRRRCHEQVLAALGLREGDHVAQIVHVDQLHDPAIETEGEAAMRRSAGLEGIEHEAEALLHLLFVVSRELEDRALDVGAVVTKGA